MNVENENTKTVQRRKKGRKERKKARKAAK